MVGGRTATLAAMLIAAGCGGGGGAGGSGDDARPDAGPSVGEAVVEGTFHGLVSFDATSRRFEPCGAVGASLLAVQDSTDGELLAAFQELAGAPGETLYVEVRGRVQPIRRGVLGTGPDRVLVVSEVRRAAAPQAGGCEDDLDGVLYRASGNEPFWRVDVTALDIALQRPEETVSFPYESARDSAGARVFTTAAPGGRSLRLEIVEERCVDSMSGFWNPFSARLMLDGGEPMPGCAIQGW